MKLNKRLIVRIMGYIMMIIGLAMLICVIPSLVYREYDMVAIFGGTSIPLIIAGELIVKTVRHKRNILKMRDGILVVAISWLTATVLGTLPYLLSGTFTDFIHAFFESASGFTTTGATIIDDLQDTPRGLLFWRSFTTWLGAMGILVLAITILPTLGIGAQNIARAETTGPTLEKMTTNISDNAKMLYLFYAGLSLIEIILLLLGGLNLFDAIIHTFGSMGTGGLSNYELGPVQFDSHYVETVISVFTVIAAINFIAFNHLIHGRIRDFFKEPEIRYFFLILGSSILIVTFFLYITNTYDSFLTSLRYGSFQVSSFMATSGYVTTDYADWPLICRTVMFTMLFIGGCSTSTSGGIKVIRVSILLKLIKRNMYKVMHPRSVVAIKLGGRPISAQVVSNTTVFILLFMIIFLGASLVLSHDAVDMETALSSSISMLSNTGTGFGAVGYGMTFDIFSDGNLLFLSFLMITGRLELFTVIMLFFPSFWRPDKFR